MNYVIENMKIRIHMLEQRGAIKNSRIIAKLKRRVRALEAK